MKRLLVVIALCACQARPPFSPDDSADLGKGLPAGFLWGTATSAHQIEGGNVNDWSDWEAGKYPDGRPHIEDGSRSDLATDSWNRFDEDLALMKHLGANAYRFSVEWSRVSPSEGEWREDVVARYREWSMKLRGAGIEPMVTLHHFTLPRWVAERGGWEIDETVRHFAAFVSRLTKALAAEVDLWCTINEPNVLAHQGWLEGTWPPGKRSSKEMALVLARLLEAHAAATAELRASDTVDADGDGASARVGIAHHVRVFQPATDSTLDVAIAGLTDEFFNEAIVRAAKEGRVRLSVPGEIEIDREVPGLAGSFDWLGINYYTRDHVRADPSDPALSKQYVPDGRPTNDLGWDIYPEGLYLFLLRWAPLGWPLYVTENGIDDRQGDKRPGFLRAHVRAVERAVAEGADVRGYFHWSLLDNFEWAHGYAPRFGLYRVDFDDPERTRSETPAVKTFRAVAENVR